MCAKWNSDYDFGLLITGLETLRVTDTAGQAAFSGYEYEDYMSVLQSAVRFSARLPETERRRIVRTAVFAALRSGTLTSKRVIAEISKQEKGFLGLQLKRFVLATSLSISYFNSIGSRQTHNARITFSLSLPKAFDRSSLLKRALRQGITELPRDYTQVRISLRGRSEFEAADLALDAFDLIRGTWNLTLNHTLIGRISSGRLHSRLEPVNQLLPGPIHTLHEPNGKPATDTFWYEPSVLPGPFKAIDIQSKWKRIQRLEGGIRKKLASSSYRADIEDGIRAYTRALDATDFNAAFLNLWRLLERLTHSLSDPYKVARKRALFLMNGRDRDFHDQVLKHLTDYRNRAVHAGEETDEIETLVFQLKFYVERLLFFHIYNNFPGMREAAGFLDLPTLTGDLRKKIKMMEKAIRFHKA